MFVCLYVYMLICLIVYLFFLCLSKLTISCVILAKRNNGNPYIRRKKRDETGGGDNSDIVGTTNK